MITTGRQRSRRFVKSTRSSVSGFTMIEIALSLAVIGFALVAIIGVLPLGINVQRENKEETIVTHDAALLMEAFRNGSRGLDDLTNYVVRIDMARTVFGFDFSKPVTPETYSFTQTNSTVPGMALTNGARIVGLLSTPKYIGRSDGVTSNYVTAYVRSMNGAAWEKSPQPNSLAREMAFTYRVTPEVIGYGRAGSVTTTNTAWSDTWVNYAAYPTNSADYKARVNYLSYATNMQNNYHEVRLIFRWPVMADGRLGNAGRQVVCSSIAGTLVGTNDPRVVQFPLFYFDPTIYSTNSL